MNFHGDVFVCATLIAKMTILLLLAWGSHCLLARANPRWRVLLWRLTLVGLFAVPFHVIFAPAWEIAVLPQPSRPAAF